MAACFASPSPVNSAESDVGPGLVLEDLLASELAGTGGQLVALAQQQLGKPYRYGGSAPSGFDCSGLVYYVYRQAGLKVPRTSRDQYRLARKLQREEMGPGDLLFFTLSPPKVSHVGIYVSDNLFIHAPSSGKGVAYASLAEDYWRQHLVGFGRLY